MTAPCIIHPSCIPADHQHPRVQVNGKTYQQSHAVYAEYHGIDIDSLKGKTLMHTCDRPRCKEPTHLVLGTQQANVADMWAKGRQGVKGMPGASHPMSKLTDADVLYIKANKTTLGKALAKRFGVSTGTISMIRTGKIWTHIKVS